jgi:hypothetical protein
VTVCNMDVMCTSGATFSLGCAPSRAIGLPSHRASSIIAC